MTSVLVNCRDDLCEEAVISDVFEMPKDGKMLYVGREFL